MRKQQIQQNEIEKMKQDEIEEENDEEIENEDEACDFLEELVDQVLSKRNQEVAEYDLSENIAGLNCSNG